MPQAESAPKHPQTPGTASSDARRQAAELTALEASIVNTLQGDFPMTHRPFDVSGQRLDLSGEQLRSTIASLLERKVLTRFGPLFQIERMGGQFVLAALQVPEERYDEVTAQVNAFDAVAHNYRRDHALNMWFVLATSTPAGMQQAIADIEQATGLPVHAFPKLEEYFVGMRFTVGGEQPVGVVAPADALEAGNARNAPGTAIQGVADKLDAIRADDGAGAQSDASAPPDSGVAVPTLHDEDWPLIRACQAGLALDTDTPYATLASQLGWTEDRVLQRLQELLDAGIIRRIGVVPNHYAIGYRFNAMGVFDVDDAAIARLGPQVGALDFVTHCYRRPRDLPLWPYNLFAMCHGSSREAVLQQIAQVRALLGTDCRGHDALFSTRILKKSGLRV